MNRQAEHDIRRKTRILEEGERVGNVSFVCRRYGISRDTYYRWKRRNANGVIAITRQKLEANKVAKRISQGEDLCCPTTF